MDIAIDLEMTLNDVKEQGLYKVQVENGTEATNKLRLLQLV